MAGLALKSATTLRSEFCGAAVVSQSGAAPKATNVAFAVRAGGYDDELVKTAVCAIRVLHFFVRCSMGGGFHSEIQGNVGCLGYITAR